MIYGDLVFKEHTAAPLEVSDLLQLFFQFLNFIDAFANCQFQMNAKRCNLNKTQCGNFRNFIFPEICRLFDQKNQIWSDMVAHSYPRIKCPIEPSTIKFKNTTIDFSFMAQSTQIPVDGYTWIIMFKVFRPFPNVRHKKRLQFCLLSEITATSDVRIINNRQSIHRQQSWEMKFGMSKYSIFHMFQNRNYQ